MIKSLLVAAAVIALLAGCGSAHHVAAPPVKPKPKPKSKPKDARPRTGPLAPLVVTILDGDRRVRVPHARVTLWGKVGRTNRHGVTVIEGPRHRLLVRVVANGYTTVTQRLNFQRRRQTIRIYQPDLQWPVYGATQARTQAPSDIHLKPPFRLIWSHAMGHLIEFPAVVWD
ncbi:MAG TPA: hypothetical protein VKB70_00020, partial [Gaiellaceae bacterium]|nr:hypothetical protein [Gaiellaceae bacterium]